MRQATHAHTQQPTRKDHGAQQQPKDITYVLGWLLLPVVIVCLAIYRWRVVKARMGYRTVRYD